MALRDKYHARLGGHGNQNNRHGKNAAPLYVDVPVGTVIKNNNGQIIADLNAHKSEFLIACGGAGGYGNKQFASNENKTPTETLPGEPGELVYAELELRLMADFGLVGLPNAGKSSMIRYLTNATPDVSDIPGTTLVPHLGQISYRDRINLTVADLPGIEPEGVPFYFNTSSRAGRFLQHCARCSSLLYIIDGDDDLPLTVSEQFQVIRSHLAEYDTTIAKEQRELQLAKTEFPDRFNYFDWDDVDISTSLTDIPFIVAISKDDLPGAAERELELNNELKKFYKNSSDILYYKKAICTSAVELTGWQIIVYLLRHMKESRTKIKTDDLYW